jgi:hypothetical protein
MASKYLSLTLSITESGKDAREETFTQESVTVGAGGTADLKIAGGQVSDIHAMFDASRGDEIFIMDLGSASGTFVNDKKVNKQKLAEGDAIKLGDVVLSVKAIGDSATAEAVVTPPADVPAEDIQVEASAEETKAEEPAEEAAAVEPAVESEVKAEEPVVEAKPEEPVEEPKAEVKADEEPAKVDAAKKAEIELEEAKALAEKQLAFQAKMKKARAKRATYDLEVLPEKNDPPKTKSTLFEAREIGWGHTLLNINHFKTPTTLTLGEKKTDNFFLSADFLPSISYPVVTGQGGNFVLHFTDKMSGKLQTNGNTETFDKVRKAKSTGSDANGFNLTLEKNMAATYEFGEIQFYFRHVDEEKLQKVPFTKTIDYPITILGVLLLLLYSVMTIYLKRLPPPEVADILDAPDRFAKLILEPVEMEEPPPPPEEEKLNIDSGEKAIGEEGKIGEEESVIDKTEGSAKKRLEDEKVANEAGILGALDRGMENMDQLFGGGGLGAGLEKNLGMLDGISGLDMRGAGGLGSRGSGMGGGGMALGIGGLGTKGRGGGKAGARYGFGAAANLQKGKTKLDIQTGNPDIRGALDKSIIARIIKKHYSQIRYCYQKELNKDPKLYGKISINFTISGKGTVSKSVVKVSTMKNTAVEQCVATTIKRIIFPQPKGGGIVVVTYPFIFKTEGAN